MLVGRPMFPPPARSLPSALQVRQGGKKGGGRVGWWMCVLDARASVGWAAPLRLLLLQLPAASAVRRPIVQRQHQRTDQLVCLSLSVCLSVRPSVRVQLRASTTTWRISSRRQRPSRCARQRHADGQELSRAERRAARIAGRPIALRLLTRSISVWLVRCVPCCVCAL